MAEPLIRPSASAALIQCPYCDHSDFGFRRVNGIHIGSQRYGMIPDTPCERVFAIHGGNSRW